MIYLPLHKDRHFGLPFIPRLSPDAGSPLARSHRTSGTLNAHTPHAHFWAHPHEYGTTHPHPVSYGVRISLRWVCCLSIGRHGHWRRRYLEAGSVARPLSLPWPKRIPLSTRYWNLLSAPGRFSCRQAPPLCPPLEFFTSSVPQTSPNLGHLKYKTTPRASGLAL